MSRLIAAVAAMAGGCSSSAGLPTDGGDVGPDVAADFGPDVIPDVGPDVSPDVGPDVSSSDAHDGGAIDCHLEIDARLPFICVPTFDDASWRNGVCDSLVNPFAPSVIERPCGGFQSRAIDFGTHRWICYYDSTTLALVGGDFTDDTTDLCDNTAYHVIAGEVPAMSCNGSSGQSIPCGSDGGGQ